MASSKPRTDDADEDEPVVSRRLILGIMATIAGGLATTFQLGQVSEPETGTLGPDTGVYGYGGTPVIDTGEDTLKASATTVGTVTSVVSTRTSQSPSGTSTPDSRTPVGTTEMGTSTSTSTGGGGGGGSGGGGGASTPTSTSTLDLDYGHQGYGEYGYGGVEI